MRLRSMPSGILVFQLGNQLEVGGGKGVGIQASLVNPFHRRAIERLRLARQQAAEEKLQVNGFFRVGMGDLGEEFADGNVHSQFLADFPDEALLEGFTRLTLAAGEFPATAQMRRGVALGDQEAAVAKNKRGADLD